MEGVAVYVGAELLVRLRRCGQAFAEQRGLPVATQMALDQCADVAREPVDIPVAEVFGGMEREASRGGEAVVDAIDHECVEMDVAAGVDAMVARTAHVDRLHGADEDAADFAAGLRAAREQEPHAVRKAENPLPNRGFVGQDVIDEVGGGLGYSTAGARRARPWP